MARPHPIVWEPQISASSKTSTVRNGVVRIPKYTISRALLILTSVTNHTRVSDVRVCVNHRRGAARHLAELMESVNLMVLWGSVTHQHDGQMMAKAEGSFETFPYERHKT
jgi:hypothetical protein